MKNGLSELFALDRAWVKDYIDLPINEAVTNRRKKRKKERFEKKVLDLTAAEK
jgi:hypothetical protein